MIKINNMAISNLPKSPKIGYFLHRNDFCTKSTNLRLKSS